MYKFLNMRSASVVEDRDSPIDDRTTRARIRDAAITCFAEHGIAGTTARKVATYAGVSAGSVMHHFGSMDGLRAACDGHVTAMIRELKGSALSAGTAFDPLSALRSQQSGPPFARYLARTIVDDSPHVTALVDEIVADAVEYVEKGVVSGMISPTRYPKERAAILTIWSLGALVLHEHLARLIGVDITEPVDHPLAASSYVAPVLEILSGFITEATVQLMSEAFVDGPAEKEGDS